MGCGERVAGTNFDTAVNRTHYLKKETALKRIILIGIVFGITSCSILVDPQNVEMRFEKEYYFKDDIWGFIECKWRTYKRNMNYIRYDKKRNIIEEGEYGERFHFGSSKVNSDNSVSVTYGEGTDFEKLNTVRFNQYDSANKKISDELWQYIDNKKSNLINKTFFEYDSIGQLVKEIEYNKDSQVSRLKTHNSIKERDKMISYRSEIRYNDKSAINVVEQDTTIIDTLNRPLVKSCYNNGIFSYRIEYRYSHNFVTEIRYENKPDSLCSITLWNYDYSKNLISKSVIEIGSQPEKEVYIYNLNNLCKKKKYYHGEDFEYYIKYKYKEFKTD